MKYRNQDEGGDLFAFIEHQKKAKASQRSTGVGRLAEVIDWEGFRSDLEDILGYVNRDDSTGGRPISVRLNIRNQLTIKELRNIHLTEFSALHADGEKFVTCQFPQRLDS